jgi:hypothetical protein
MVVKPTRYKEKPENLETTSFTLRYIHTTRTCRAVDDDDEDDGHRDKKPLRC